MKITHFSSTPMKPLQLSLACAGRRKVSIAEKRKMSTANPSLDLCHRMGEGRGPPTPSSDGGGRRPATTRGHQAATAATRGQGVAAAVRSQGTIAALLGVDLQPSSPLEANPQLPPPLEVDPQPPQPLRRCPPLKVDPVHTRRARDRPAAAAVSTPPPAAT
jgi:hypothetical protein